MYEDSADKIFNDTDDNERENKMVMTFIEEIGTRTLNEN